MKYWHWTAFLLPAMASEPAFAYLDPGTGSMLLQVILGGIAAVGVAIFDANRAMEAAGPDLTAEKMVAELEKIRNYPDPFGGPSVSFGPEKHQGTDSLLLAQIIDGRWVDIVEHIPYLHDPATD